MLKKVPDCNWDEISAKSELNFGKGLAVCKVLKPREENPWIWDHVYLW